jgi:predicted glycoside hydrolase/deacetylase ChbG (UPF0249 family)
MVLNGEDRKQLIIHCDDLGMAHAINIATARAFDCGAITSASAMVPCPWFSEVVQYSRERPDWDIGLHLTLTSEWNLYRWSPILPHSVVPSLVGPDGYFHRNPCTVRQRAKLNELEAELRAQIERSLTLGLRPSHVDTHMFVLFQSPRFYESFARVATEYDLPFLMPSTGTSFRDCPGFDARSPVKVDSIIRLRPPIQLHRASWLTWYRSTLKQLGPGVHQMIVHLGADDAELSAITGDIDAWGSSWRQLDFDVVTSDTFRSTVAEEGIILSNWKTLRQSQHDCGSQ